MTILDPNPSHCEAMLAANEQSGAAAICFAGAGAGSGASFSRLGPIAMADVQASKALFSASSSSSFSAGPQAETASAPKAYHLPEGTWVSSITLPATTSTVVDDYASARCGWDAQTETGAAAMELRSGRCVPRLLALQPALVEGEVTRLAQSPVAVVAPPPPQPPVAVPAAVAPLPPPQPPVAVPAAVLPFHPPLPVAIPPLPQAPAAVPFPAELQVLLINHFSNVIPSFLIFLRRLDIATSTAP